MKWLTIKSTISKGSPEGFPFYLANAGDVGAVLIPLA